MQIKLLVLLLLLLIRKQIERKYRIHALSMKYSIYHFWPQVLKYFCLFVKFSSPLFRFKFSSEPVPYPGAFLEHSWKLLLVYCTVLTIQFCFARIPTKWQLIFRLCGHALPSKFSAHEGWNLFSGAKQNNCDLFWRPNPPVTIKWMTEWCVINSSYSFSFGNLAIFLCAPVGCLFISIFTCFTVFIKFSLTQGAFCLPINMGEVFLDLR